MNEILLTMGMPVYNEEKYIGKAIESLLAQTYKNFILIISDNASTDRTQQICEGYAHKDKRITYIRHKENKGALFNFRYVLEQTTTPYFMWCAGHDKWHPLFVEKLLPALGKDNIILSYSNVRLIGLDGTIGKTYECYYDTTSINSPVKRLFCLLRLLNEGSMFNGVWLTQALKSCAFDFKTHFFDNTILEQASLEGKFKQNKEVLFWFRFVRAPETKNEAERRQLIYATGKESSAKASINAQKTMHLFESVKIIFIKKYRVPVIDKIRLTAAIIYYKSIILFVLPIVHTLLDKILPEKAFLKLKKFWRKNHYKG